MTKRVAPIPRTRRGCWHEFPPEARKVSDPPHAPGFLTLHGPCAPPYSRNPFERRPAWGVRPFCCAGRRTVPGQFADSGAGGYCRAGGNSHARTWSATARSRSSEIVSR